MGVCKHLRCGKFPVVINKIGRWGSKDEANKLEKRCDRAGSGVMYSVDEGRGCGSGRQEGCRSSKETDLT